MISSKTRKSYGDCALARKKKDTLGLGHAQTMIHIGKQDEKHSRKQVE